LKGGDEQKKGRGWMSLAFFDRSVGLALIILLRTRSLFLLLGAIFLVLSLVLLTWGLVLLALLSRLIAVRVLTLLTGLILIRVLLLLAGFALVGVLTLLSALLRIAFLFVSHLHTPTISAPKSSTPRA
jgi:hypothetical protein